MLARFRVVVKVIFEHVRHGGGLGGMEGST